MLERRKNVTNKKNYIGSGNREKRKGKLIRELK